MSVRRHARLVDYFMHDGCNARVVGAASCDDAAGVRLPAGTPAADADRNGPAARDLASTPTAYAAGASRQARRLRDRCTTHARSRAQRLHFHTWSDERCCLLEGATRATLRGRLPNSAAGRGDVLVFEEVLGPAHGRAGRRRIRRTATPCGSTGVDAGAMRIRWMAHGNDRDAGDRARSGDRVEIVEIEWARRRRVCRSRCALRRSRRGHGGDARREQSRARQHRSGRSRADDRAGRAMLGSPAPSRCRPSSSGDAEAQRRCDRPRVRSSRFRRDSGRRCAASARHTAVAVLSAPLRRRGPAASSRRAVPADAAATTNRSAFEEPVRGHAQRDLLGQRSRTTGISSSRSKRRTRACASATIGTARGASREAGCSRHLPRRQRRRPATSARHAHRPRRHRMRAAFSRSRNPHAAARRHRAGDASSRCGSARRRPFAAGARRTRRRLRGAWPRARRDVQRAAATMRWTGSWHTVFVTVDRTRRRATSTPRSRRDLRRTSSRTAWPGTTSRSTAPVRAARARDARLREARLLPQRRQAALLDVFSNRMLADGAARHVPSRQFQLRPDRLPEPAATPPRRRSTACASVDVTRFQRHGGRDPAPCSTTGKLTLGRARDRAARQRSELPRARRAAARRWTVANEAGVEPSLRRPSDCGCCAGTRDRDAGRRSRTGPGLSAIAYRVGTHAQLQGSACWRGCRAPTTRRSAASTTRDDDDFTDRAARRVGDRRRRAHVLPGAHRQRVVPAHRDRAALARSSWRGSSATSSRPGVAASAYLAFTLEDAPGGTGHARATISTRHEGAEHPRARERSRRRSRRCDRSRRASNGTP